jgi:hypothetical protein
MQQIPRTGAIQTKEEVLEAFMAISLLPSPDQLILNHITALLALLVFGRGQIAMAALLVPPLPAAQAEMVLATWAPHIPPAPEGRTLASEDNAKAAIFVTLCTRYATAKLAGVVAQDFMEFVVESILPTIIVAHTVVTLEDERMEAVHTFPPSCDTHGPNNSAQGSYDCRTLYACVTMGPQQVHPRVPNVPPLALQDPSPFLIPEITLVPHKGDQPHLLDAGPTPYGIQAPSCPDGASLSIESARSPVHEPGSLSLLAPNE